MDWRINRLALVVVMEEKIKALRAPSPIANFSLECALGLGQPHYGRALAPHVQNQWIHFLIS